jgi:hypothetical protein
MRIWSTLAAAFLGLVMIAGVSLASTTASSEATDASTLPDLVVNVPYVPITGPAKQPWSSKVRAIHSADTAWGSQSVVVSPDKWLVIETLSVSVSLPATAGVSDCHLTISGPGNDFTYGISNVDLTPTSNAKEATAAGGLGFIGSLHWFVHPIACKLYCPPGGSLVWSFVSYGLGGGWADLYYSGYLTDQPL